MQLCNAMELDDNELSALKTYFHQRGLQLPNENLIVVIKNRQQEQEKVTEKQFQNIRKNKEKWQNIYEKYKEKYQQSSTMSFQCPDAQSTPKIPEHSTISEVPKIAMEKGSQTSLVKNAVKSIQTTPPADQTVESKTQEQFEIYHNPSEVAESFEFVRGSRVKENKKSSSESSSKLTVSEAGSSKNSEISESIKNVNVTNFDDSLKVAIALLNSLLESSMRPELKRNLAEKVIQKIVHMQTSRSIQTSTIDSSVYPRSNSSAVQSEKDEKPDRPPYKNREKVLRDCLQPMTKSEMSHQNSQNEDSSKGTLSIQSIPKSQLVDFAKREKHSQLKWIEKEIEHLNSLRDLLKRNETPIPFENPIYENTKKKEKPLPEVPPVDTNVWNSHANMKKVKNRSKLELPKGESESLASFIDTRNKSFLEKYNKQQKQLQDEEANAYTQPYSSGSRKNPPLKATRKSSKDAQTSTSLASSVFESSDSMSEPVNSNSKTTTTHYEAEAFSSENRARRRKQKVAITQTTDSICRTKPIYEVRNDNNEVCGTISTTTITRRVKKLQNDKQMQTKPPSVKYTLTFDKKNKPNVQHYASLPQRSEYATITKSSKDIYNQMSYASLNYREYVENKENYDNDILIDNKEEEEEYIDLQKCLNSNRPDIFTRFEKRKKCIEELKKLR